MGNVIKSSLVNVNSNVKADFFIADIDDAGDPLYFGFVSTVESWYIMKYTEATGVIRYAIGNKGYANAWTNRATQTYDYFHVRLQA